MKKTIFSMLLVAGSGAVFAQIDTTTRTTGIWNQNNATMRTDSMNNTGNWNNNNMNNATNNSGNLTTSGNYSAYGSGATVPAPVQGYMQRDYPTASNIMWQQNGEWYHAAYNENGKFTHVYYNDRGANFMVALPVVQSFIPDGVMSKVHTMYGPMVYDVTMIKGSAMQPVYHARLIEGGQVRSQFFGEDGAVVTDPFVLEHNMNTNTNNTSINGNKDLNGNQNSSTSDMMKRDSSLKNIDGNKNNTDVITTDSTNINTGATEAINLTTTQETQKSDKTKTEIIGADGKKTTIKTKPGKVKVKED